MAATLLRFSPTLANKSSQPQEQHPGLTAPKIFTIQFFSFIFFLSFFSFFFYI
jgi:hypothetical protein